MRYIKQFNQQLHDNQTKFPVPKGNSIEYIQTKQLEITDILKNAKTEQPNPHLVQQTLNKFVRNLSHNDFTWLELSFLCWGLNTVIANFPERTILGSDKAFQALQKLIEDAITAYLWQGLWLAFLNFNDIKSDIARNNWRILRDNLHNSLNPLLATMQFLPSWLEAIERHQIIFDSEVTQKLARQALNNDYRKINLLKQDIEIPSTSWFWIDFLTAQVQEIITYDDLGFKNTLDRLLEQLPEHPEYIDKGLAELLNRYAECSDNSVVHLELKKLAVQRWESPVLEKQREWERVYSKTKEMVQRWLVREDIYDIFHKLANDHRRYEFWMQFFDKIDYTFVWLGKKARENQEINFLKQKEGRCANLSGGYTANNNAILMKIGDVYIVESGAVSGGKCWAYPSSIVLPWLQKNAISYDSLRNPWKCLWHTQDGLSHVGVWEDDFLTALSRLGIKPTVMSFEQLITHYQLKVEKLPSGVQYIQHNRRIGTLAKELNRHGYEYNYSQNIFYNLIKPLYAISFL
ncbi:MAG: EH signature domain-containing protein [Methylococcales bacterium]